MVKLERIVPGSSQTGVVGDAAVEIVLTRACSPDAVEVVWKGPDASATVSSALTGSMPCHLREVRERLLLKFGEIESAVMKRMRREITQLEHYAPELQAEERSGRCCSCGS